MTPEEFHKQLQDMMKRMGASGPMPPFPGMGATTGPDSGGNPQNDEETEERDLAGDFHFDLKPRDVKTHLDKWVIRQDEAKKVLAVALCDHYNHVLQVLEAEKNGDKDDRYNKNYAKQNVFFVRMGKLRISINLFCISYFCSPIDFMFEIQQDILVHQFCIINYIMN